MADYTPTDSEELFIEYLEETPSIAEASRRAGLTLDKGYHWSSKLKDVIQKRARDKLAVATLRAVDTVVKLVDADVETTKGELRLKAAESVLDRTGVTKHTNVDVQIEADNGIFLLPTKTVVPEESTEDPSDNDGYPENTDEPEGNSAEV